MASEAEFWKWSLKYWRVEGVEERLLELQDDHGMVVLEILMAAWLASLGVRLSAKDWQAMVAAADPWVEGVVVPLRQQRQLWRDQAIHAGLYSEVKKLELSAERSLASIYVEALADAGDTDEGSGDAQRGTQADDLGGDPVFVNLARVLSRANPPLAQDQVPALAELLGAKSV